MSPRAWSILVALSTTGCSAGDPVVGAVEADGGAPSTVLDDGGAREDPVAPKPDVRDDASAPDGGLRLAIGVGEAGQFVPSAAGSILALQRGCQGAQHVFTSLRLRGFSGTHALVRLVIRRTEDQLPVSVPVASMLPVEDDPLSDSALRLTGLTPVIEAPRDVLGRSVDVEATVTAPNGDSATASLTGIVEWGPDSCRGH